MPRRKHHEEHANHEAWAIPYGDLVTLLLAFFVVMYAISSVNEGKYRVMADALSSAFGGPPRTISPLSIGQTQLRGAAFDRPSLQTAAAKNGTTVLLTTQYLDEAEQLADRIAILHKGTIIQNGTLAELKQLLPAAKVEYVEKQPTLEDVFLALVGSNGTTEATEDRS